MTPTADEGSVVRAVEPVPALVLGGPVSSATRALVFESVDETSSRPLPASGQRTSDPRPD
jgi:hypothetical protein